MTETQISALIQIKVDRSNEKLGVCVSAVAENITYMSDRPCKKTWHHKSSNERNPRIVEIQCLYHIRVQFHTYHEDESIQKERP